MVSRNRATIKQVAQEAGVSPQTVSRVINDRPDVAPATRRRVKEVIDRLGYRPSQIARSLAQGRSRVLGVIARGLEYYGPSRALAAIERQAGELGYNLFLKLLSQPGREGEHIESALRDILSFNLAGIIYTVFEIQEDKDLPGQLPVPTVLLDRGPVPGFTTVAVDAREGGRMATKHLLDQGRRRVGLITGPLEWWTARQRQLGWMDAMEEAGLPIEESLVAQGDWSAGSGERAMYQLLDLYPRLDAVFVSNDRMSIGVLRALYERGLGVPDDLAVVGFDDIPEAAYFHPPLSTVRQDLDRLGRYAVRMLDRMIEVSQHDGTIEPEAVLLQPQLVVRQSSLGKEVIL
jgi:DNA-binding LacI/PurR family transcriptional regulator